VVCASHHGVQVYQGFKQGRPVRED
jgi:hypothetical protein